MSAPRASSVPTPTRRAPASMPTITRLVSDLSIDVRSGRERLKPPDHDLIQSSPTFAQIWFPTAGCPWDALGHCTTCNYGVSEAVDPEQMILAVELALAKLAPTTEEVWVSAFDTLFDKEVPKQARDAIFTLMSRTGAKDIVTETHPASVKASVVKGIVDALGEKHFWVELGIETMDEFVRYACLNKPFSNSLLTRSVETIKNAGAYVCGNFLAGIPFLNEDEIIDDMTWSINNGFAIGLDTAVLFANYVKEYTVASVLLEDGRYVPPDIWTLKEILARLDRALWPKIQLGWLDPKEHPGAGKIAGLSPDDDETAALRSLLRRYNTDREMEALAEAITMDRPRDLIVLDSRPLLDRVIDNVHWLAVRSHGEGWWSEHERVILDELMSALVNTSGGIRRRTDGVEQL